MNTQVTWGMLIAMYLFLGGVSAGAAILAGVSELFGRSSKGLVKPAAYLAPFPVVLGLLLLIFDLHRPLNFYQLLLNYNFSSVMAWGVIVLLLFTPASIAFAGIMFLDKDVCRKPLAMANLILGIAVAAYTGLLLSAVSTNPVWGNPLLPVLFLVSAISTGVCGTILVASFVTGVDHELLKKLAIIDGGLIALELVILAVLVLGWALSPTGDIAMKTIVTGEFAAMFWGAVVLIGLLLPLAIIYKEIKGQGSQFLAVTSAALVLGGGFFLRYLIVYGGQIIFPYLGNY